MSWFTKKSLFVILALLSGGFTQKVLAQVASCDASKGYMSYPGKPGDCYYITEGVLWLGGPVKTTVNITNTTSGEVQYDLIPSGSFWYTSNTTVSVFSTFDNSTDATPGNTTSIVESGKPKTITFLGTAPICSAGVCQPGGDSVLVQLYMRVVATPDLLDQQKDSAIVITTAYAPDVVTTALPWSFSATSVRRSSLQTGSMGNFTETLPGPVPDVMDKHNLFLVTNVGGVDQTLQISVLDNNNNVITQAVTRTVANDEAYLVNLFQLFGASMLPGGVSIYGGRVSVKGLGGGIVFTQTVELDGGYATITQPTWPVSQ